MDSKYLRSQIREQTDQDKQFAQKQARTWGFGMNNNKGVQNTDEKLMFKRLRLRLLARNRRDIEQQMKKLSAEIRKLQGKTA